MQFAVGMASQESTAISDLIALVQGGRSPERTYDDPVPELFVPAVRLQEQTVTQARFEVPSLDRARSAKGTPAPQMRQAVMQQPQQYAIPPQPLPTYSLPVPIAQGTPAPAYRVPTHHHVEQDDEQTELWQGTPRPVQHAPTSAIVMPVQQAKPVSNPYIPTRPDLSKLPRELSPAIRYAGLGFLALAAISIGTYLGASSGGGGSSNELDERDRAIAIMNGQLPAPTPTTRVVAPTMPTVRIEATPAPTVEPIGVDEHVEKEEKPAEVIWSPPVVIDSEEIEMAAETRKPNTRRTPRVAKQPTIAIAKAEKPAKAEKADKKAKKESKKEKALIATEISAPKGALGTTGTGSITISSNRPAMIFLDGRATGKSAPAALVIPAGDHQITLLDPSTKKAKTATVTIAANKSLAISKDFN